MKIFRILSLLFFLCLAILAKAQKYEVDCLVGPELKAVAADKPTDFDGSRNVIYIRNGTIVNVVERIVVGTDGQTVSHFGQAGDSIDVRQIKGLIEYDGKRYLAEARWLKFSDQNPPSVSDRFASDDFRLFHQLASWLDLPRIDIHSDSTRFLYSGMLPFVALLLMFAAVWMALKTRFLLLSALPFLVAVGICIYMIAMIDWDALWWCNPDYVGINHAIVGIIPVVLFMALTLLYLFSVTIFAKDALLIWPLVVGYLLQWPAMLLSAHFMGSIWPALLVCYGIPALINGLRIRLYGVVMTIVVLVAIHTFVVAVATVVQISIWILMALALASPLIAFILSTVIGKYHYSHQGRWVLRDGKTQFVYTDHIGDVRL